MAVTLSAVAAFLAWTGPGLLLGFNSFTFSWWDQPWWWLHDNGPVVFLFNLPEVRAFIFSAMTLLLAAAIVWKMASVLFERTGRR